MPKKLINSIMILMRQDMFALIFASKTYFWILIINLTKKILLYGRMYLQYSFTQLVTDSTSLEPNNTWFLCLVC